MEASGFAKPHFYEQVKGGRVRVFDRRQEYGRLAPVCNSSRQGEKLRAHALASVTDPDTEALDPVTFRAGLALKAPHRGPTKLREEVKIPTICWQSHVADMGDWLIADPPTSFRDSEIKGK